MKFKFAVTMILRPYLTIEADTEEDARAILMDEEFDKSEVLETGFPASNIEINEIYCDGDA